MIFSVDKPLNPYNMIRWSITFLIIPFIAAFFCIAIVAALLGFHTIAVSAAGIDKILFYIFAVLVIISFSPLKNDK
jgi:uncharacterized membrane protein YtjA (UPF0391 family)